MKSIKVYTKGYEIRKANHLCNLAVVMFRLGLYEYIDCTATNANQRFDNQHWCLVIYLDKPF